MKINPILYILFSYFSCSDQSQKSDQREEIADQYLSDKPFLSFQMAVKLDF